jgi:ligand-binding sensor domain-containing protein
MSFPYRRVPTTSARSHRAARAWLLVVITVMIAAPAVFAANRQGSGNIRGEFVFTPQADVIGLSPVVRDLHQTRDGYLWIATEAGLSRFDGSKHRIFRATNVPELKHSIVRVLAEDATGALWIGTEHGLSRHANGVFTAIDLPDTAIVGLTVDRRGAVWIATETKGLYVHLHGQLHSYAT